MMKKSGIFYLTSVALLACVIAISSCKKKETSEVDGENQSVVDNSVAEQEFMQIQPNTNNLAINTKGTSVKKGASVCDTLKFISGDTVNFSTPVKFEYDYSTASCPAALLDGISRSGKVLITYLGKPKLAGSKTIIKLLNYKLNNAIAYSCDSMVVTTNTVTASSYAYNVKVINGVCTGATGWTVKFSCDKNITINLNNPGGSDDVVTIPGYADGVNRLGR
jgi:hypothetical protein